MFWPFTYRRQTIPQDVKTRLFLQLLNIVKDLDSTEFNKLVDGLKKLRESYQTISKIRTLDEKENDFEDIVEIEKTLDKICQEKS